MTNTNTLIDRYIIKKNKEEGTKHEKLKKNEFYISQAGKCPKEIYFEKTLDYTHPPATLKIFLLGDMLHKFLQMAIFSDMESEVQINFQVGDLFFRGRADLLGKIKDSEGKEEDTIYELKSCSKLPATPYLHHRMQINLYLYGLKLQRGKLIYTEKNTFKVKEFDVEYNEELFKETLSQFKTVFNAMNDNTEPMGVKNYNCTYGCLYSNECIYGKK